MAMQLKSFVLRASCAALLLSAAVCCSNIIGVEEAACNPNLPACHATGGGDSGAPNSLCQEYCNTVMQNCTGNVQVYVGRETCLSVCKILPGGQAGDEKVNSVHCRLSQAKLAGTIPEPAIHCAGAGPGGNGLCGDNCEGLCTMPAVKATDGNEYYNTVAKEMSAGDSRECRLWHASVATQSPDPHCTHASGASPCR
jgi:hypothetical protein